MVNLLTEHPEVKPFNTNLLEPSEAPAGPSKPAFCHRRLLAVSRQNCAACFAGDSHLQDLYRSRAECDAANTSPSIPTAAAGLHHNEPIATETVARALALDSFEPIERVLAAYPRTDFALIRA